MGPEENNKNLGGWAGDVSSLLTRALGYLHIKYGSFNGSWHLVEVLGFGQLALQDLLSFFSY